MTKAQVDNCSTFNEGEHLYLVFKPKYETKDYRLGVTLSTNTSIPDKI